MSVALSSDELQKILSALETGREYAFDCAETFHVEMRGYKQQRHDAMDADVKELDEAIAFVKRLTTSNGDQSG